MKTYVALERGQTPDRVWHKAGETFTTDAPQGKWMKLVEEEKPRRGRPPVDAASDE